MPRCCDTPAPRISETTGRMFCANCRRYLDRLPAPPQTTSGTPEDSSDDESTDTTADQEGDPE
jgi:hypothetical protein